MKNPIVIVAGVVTLCAVLNWSARLSAQQPEKQPAPAAKSVAIVNLHAVLKGYQKTKVYDQEVEDLVAPMRKQGKELKKKIAEMTKALKTKEDKEDLKNAIRDQKRLLEDLENKASKEVAKMRERQLVKLYKEIEEGVSRVAIAKGFSLVLHYTEPATKEEKYSPENIQRKLAGSSQTGATIPLYYYPGLEISAEVIANLNASFNKTQQAGSR